MSTELNTKLTRRVFDEAFNQGKLDVIDELCAPNYVLHDPTGDIKGPAGFKEYVRMYRTAFPDTRINIENTVSEGDYVVVRSRFTGTQRGQLQNIPPTGKHIDMPGLIMTRMVNGKATESWVEYDELQMMQQLGVAPRQG